MINRVWRGFKFYEHAFLKAIGADAQADGAEASA